MIAPFIINIINNYEKNHFYYAIRFCCGCFFRTNKHSSSNDSCYGRNR